MPETPPPAEPTPAAADAAPASAELSPAACAAQLAALFPALFTPGAPKPVKLRIQLDIQQRAPGVFSKRALSHFLQRHTTSTAYLKALLKSAQRVDLDGEPAGEIADEHRQAAQAELERRLALHAARRAAEREAERNARRDAQREADDTAHREREADGQQRAHRAALLRAHDATTLTRKNFCALKGVAEAELDALLALARKEREQSASAPRPDRPDAHAAERPLRRDRRDPRPPPVPTRENQG